MATINFLVKRYDNPASIYLRFKHGRGHDYTKNTGYIIDPKDWNSEKKFPKQKKAHLKNLATDLAHLSNELLKRFNKVSKNEVSGEWLQIQIGTIKGDIKPEQQRSDVLTDCIQYLIDTADTRVKSNGNLGLSKSRVNSYKNLLKIIKAYQVYKEKTYKVSEVDIKFGTLFLDWMLKKKNYSESYSRKKIDDLKTVCREAEIFEIQISPQLKKIKGGKPKNNSIVYLSTAELNILENTPFINDAHKNALKWLLFGCNIGQRGGDLLKITENNFVTRKGLEVIELEQQKTGNQVTIPILEKTKDILKNGLPYPIAIQNFNTYIKEICKIAGIEILTKGGKVAMVDKEGNEIPKDKNGKYIAKGEKRKIYGSFPKHELVTSHICRRSFASNLYGVLPTPLIMRITSHSTEKMLLNYIGKDSLDFAQQIADFYKKEEQRQAKDIKLEVIKNIANK